MLRTYITSIILLAVFVTAAHAGYVETVMSESSLVAYYRFDDDTGIDQSTAKDETSSFTGIYEGAVGISSTDAPDIGVADNKAADFESITNYIDIGTLGALGAGLQTNGITVEMWVKGTSTSQGVPIGGYGTSCFFVNLNESPEGDETQGNIRVYGQGNGVGKRAYGGVSSNTGILDGTWNYLAITFKGVSPGNAEMSVYIADEGGATTTSQTTMFVVDALSEEQNFTDAIFMGAINMTGAPGLLYDSLLDEVAIYNTVLSQSELNTHVAAAVPEPTTMMLLTLGGGLCILKRRRQ